MNRWLNLLALTLLSPLAMAQDYSGILEWDTRATLSSPLNGKVNSVKVQVGDQVKKGDLLATLDARPFQARVKQAEARVSSLQTRFVDIEREYSRAKELYERTVLSTTDLQTAEVKLNSAEAELAEARAILQQAKVELEYTQLRAPFDGLVTERNINPQEVVSNQFQVTPMLRMVATDSLNARFWIPASAASGIKPGDKTSAVVNGNSIDAQVRYLGLQTRDENQGLETELVLKLGAFASGDLSAGWPVSINLP